MAATPETTRYQQYELLRRPDGSLWELGRGAMGTTYKAYDTNLHCTVANMDLALPPPTLWQRIFGHKEAKKAEFDTPHH